MWEVCAWHLNRDLDNVKMQAVVSKSGVRAVGGEKSKSKGSEEGSFEEQRDQLLGSWLWRVERDAVKEGVKGQIM